MVPKQPSSSHLKVWACHGIQTQWHPGGSDGSLTAGVLHSYFCLNSPRSQAHGIAKVSWALCNSSHSQKLHLKKNKIKLKNTKPQASAQNEALRCSQQDGAFRVCTVQTGAMQRWLRWLGKIQRCNWIAVEKGLMCNHWTWKRLRGIHLISPHEKNHIPQPCKSYWERMKNERKDQAAFQLCPQIK